MNNLAFTKLVGTFSNDGSPSIRIITETISLSNEGKELIEGLLSSFKEKLAKLCDATIQEVYCDVAQHIESDHIANCEIQAAKKLARYENGKMTDFYKDLRKQILLEHREALLEDLNEDLIAQIDSLEEEIDELKSSRDMW